MIADQDKSLASPCINVCQMDALSGLCRGCFRTLDEISGWSRAADEGKRSILLAVSRRRSGHVASGNNFAEAASDEHSA